LENRFLDRREPVVVGGVEGFEEFSAPLADAGDEEDVGDVRGDVWDEFFLWLASP
jgi:hypothetical protein